MGLFVNEMKGPSSKKRKGNEGQIESKVPFLSLMKSAGSRKIGAGNVSNTLTALREFRLELELELENTTGGCHIICGPPYCARRRSRGRSKVSVVILLIDELADVIRHILEMYPVSQESRCERRVVIADGNSSAIGMHGVGEAAARKNT